MRDLERLAAGSGIGGVALFLVSTFMVSSPPVASDTDAEIGRWLADHGSTLRAAQYVAGLAIVLFFWFIGTLWSHLRRTEGPSGRLAQTFLAAAVAIGTVFLVQSGMLVVATYAPHSAISATLFRLSIELGPHTAFFFAAMVGATALLILRHGGLPRMLGVYCAAFALYELVEGACVINRDGALSPGGAINVAGPILFSIWGIWTSGALVQLIGSSRPRDSTTSSASVL